MAALAAHHLRDGLEDDHEADGLFLSLMLKQLTTALRGGKVEAKQAAVHLTVKAQFDIAALHAQAKAQAEALRKDPVFQLAKQRRISGNNLKQIMLAMHAHNDTYRALPPGAICSKKDGKPLLSWRVAILPYLEQDALYREFKLDEPWDSAHNIKLLPRMPTTYAPVGIKTKEPHATFYQVFVGPGAVFEIRPDANATFGARGIN